MPADQPLPLCRSVVGARDYSCGPTEDLIIMSNDEDDPAYQNRPRLRQPDPVAQNRPTASLFQVTWPQVIKWGVISIAFVGVSCAVLYKLHSLKSFIEALKITVETENTRNLNMLDGLQHKMMNELKWIEELIKEIDSDRLVSLE